MRAIEGAAKADQVGMASSPRLVRAAHEFEGQMMKELLKPMTGEDGDSDSDTGSSSALGEFASEALGQALSLHGGFGIANRIVGELAHFSNPHEGGKGTGNQQIKGPMRPPQ